MKSHSLPGPEDIFRAELPNGIVVLARSNFNSPSVAVSGYLPVGALFDPDEKLGRADFTAISLMRGTQKRTFEQIYDAMESVGAGVGISCGTRTSGFSGRALVEDLPLVFELLSDALRIPVFPSDEIERLRAQLLTALSIRAQDTGEMASLTFDEIIYEGHPYRRPDDGFPETVRAITRSDLVEFHRKHFGPRGMVIGVVGAVEPQKVLDDLNRIFGDWQNPEQPHLPELPPLKPIHSIVRKHVSIPGKAQSDVMIGAAGPSRLDPLYSAASLANSVLGQFGMMGRIGDVVRERSGLAYYAYSSLSAGIGPGSWEVSAGVNPANLQKTIDLILQELTNFYEHGITEEELRDSQDSFVGRLPLSLESNHDVLHALLNMERYKLGLDYYQDYERRVRSITPERALEAIRAYLNPEKLVIASAGS